MSLQTHCVSLIPQTLSPSTGRGTRETLPKKLQFPFVSLPNFLWIFIFKCLISVFCFLCEYVDFWWEGNGHIRAPFSLYRGMLLCGLLEHPFLLPCSEGRKNSVGVVGAQRDYCLPDLQTFIYINAMVLLWSIKDPLKIKKKSYRPIGLHTSSHSCHPLAHLNTPYVSSIVWDLQTRWKRNTASLENFCGRR